MPLPRTAGMPGRVAGSEADVRGRRRTLHVVVAGKALRGALRQPDALRRADAAKVCSHQGTPVIDLIYVQRLRQSSCWLAVECGGEP